MFVEKRANQINGRNCTPAPRKQQFVQTASEFSPIIMTEGMRGQVTILPNNPGRP